MQIVSTFSESTSPGSGSPPQSSLTVFHSRESRVQLDTVHALRTGEKQLLAFFRAGVSWVDSSGLHCPKVLLRHSSSETTNPTPQRSAAHTITSYADRPYPALVVGAIEINSIILSPWTIRWSEWAWTNRLLCLNTCSLVGGTGWGGVALLKWECHWGWAPRFQKAHTISVCLLPLRMHGDVSALLFLLSHLCSTSWTWNHKPR